LFGVGVAYRMEAKRRVFLFLIEGFGLDEEETKKKTKKQRKERRKDQETPHVLLFVLQGRWYSKASPPSFVSSLFTIGGF